MTDLFLIAHKVRGKPAFDVATRMRCPECVDDQGNYNDGCAQCDDTGFWWIIPTSGHRAYPYMSVEIKVRENFIHLDGDFEGNVDLPEMPASLPDHYIAKQAPTISLSEALSLRPKAKPFDDRRI